MKAPDFAYARPGTLDEALALLDRHGENARILAGGQSLMATLNMRLSAPDLLIDINRIPDLSGITLEGGRLRIGALTRHAEVARSSQVARHAPLVAEAMKHVAHPAIRNRGTIGGSLAFADPAAELPACAVALGARLVLVSGGGTRIVDAVDFFQGLYLTALTSGEILVAIDFPVAAPSCRHGFAEIARRHGDYAIVGLACRTTLRDGRYDGVRLVYFSAGDRPILAATASRSLDGLAPSNDAHEAAADALDADLDPPEDLNASAEMRRHLAKVLTRRVLGGAARMTELAKEAAITVRVNGETVTRRVPVRRNLVDFLRHDLGLTGSHVGCEHGVCGACTVRLDGMVVRGCLLLAVQADGASVETIEGVSASGEIAELQAEFVARNALQCGFCTPGMLLTASELLAEDEALDRARIRAHIAGNFCRCTGYQSIVDAIEAVAQRRRDRKGD